MTVKELITIQITPAQAKALQLACDTFDAMVDKTDDEHCTNVALGELCVKIQHEVL